MKTQILAAIGETELQPKAALATALAANDRIKYAFSLLQLAMAYAEHPEQPAATLERERIACGIDDPQLDSVIAGARMAGTSCRIAGAAGILARIRDDVRLMAAPLMVSAHDGLAARVDTLLAALPVPADDLLDPGVTTAMMQAAHDGPDSLHRLVMDMHKRLGGLQAASDEEMLDGAAVTNLTEADRPLVTAFMTGLRRTAGLKFSHPGLATNAIRAGKRLVIQNDIGTTDAHVIVIHIEGLGVSVTYTDIHAERLAFFQGMLKPYPVIWDTAGTALLAPGAPFYLATGNLLAANDVDCRAYLDFLGSRLVFLIDWNRARKQVRVFLRRPDRLELLRWAAESGVGHRGFLELGGARLVNRAIEAVAGSSMHFGDRLCDVLGAAETQAFMRFVFQAATEGLLAGQTPALVRDRVRVALARQFSDEGRQLLHLVADHAGLVFELAALVRDGLTAEPGDAAKRTRRAGRFEHDADHLVVEMRDAVRRRAEYAALLPLLETADRAANGLEDAAFLCEVDALQGKPLDGLRTLADLLAEMSREWVKAVGHAAQVGRSPVAKTIGKVTADPDGAETEDFLAAIDRVHALEHQASDAARALAMSAVQHAGDFRQLHLFTGIGGKLGAAADALKHASFILRDHVLDSVIDG